MYPILLILKEIFPLIKIKAGFPASGNIVRLIQLEDRKNETGGNRASNDYPK